MVSAKIRSQKIIRVTAKLYSSRKPPRHAYRKKLNRLTRYCRRELFRAKYNKIFTLLSTTRPYLRARTNRALLRKQPPKKSAHCKYVRLPAGRAEKLTKVKIVSALLRRKRYQYKKLTYQLLKARRLQWLRATRAAKREKTLRLKGVSKSAVHALTLLRTAQIARVGPSLRRKITLLLSARRLDHLNRSNGLKARRSKGRFKLRRPIRRPLKLRHPRGRYLQLQLRHKLRRRSRKLRQRVSKRSSRRSRRKLLIAASRPARQYLYYRRLVRTQRAGASIQRLRALRPTPPSLTVTRTLSCRNHIEQSWHLEMIRIAPHRTTTTRKRALKGQKVDKSSLPTATKAGISTIKSKLPKRITVEGIRTLLRKGGGKFSSNKYQRAATTRPFLKSSFIGPLTRWQLRTRAREARRRSRKSLTRRAMAVRATPKKFKRVKGRSNAPIRRWSVRPFLQANLQVEPSVNATLTDRLFTVQSLLRTSTSKLNHLKQIKRRKVTVRKTCRNRKATTRLTKLVNRLMYEQSWLKVSSKKNQPVTAPRHISATELRRTIIAATARTPSGRRPLIRRYLEAGRLLHVQLYDLRPRVDHTAIARLPRKSSRRKRYLVKRRRVLVAKIKRKLRRRRSRQRMLTVKKRKYQLTPRSPVHAGRTVIWKERSGHRYQLHRKLGVAQLLFKKVLRVKRTVATILQPAKGHTLGRSLLWALLQFVTEAKSNKQDQLVTRLSGTIRRMLRRNFIPAVPLMRLLLLKAFTLATTTADLAKKMQLLVLERRWLSATTARITPLLRKKVSKSRSKKRITIGVNLKSNRYLQPRPIARRGRSVAAAKRRLTAKILHLKQIYRKGVKRFLPRRKLIIRLRLLKPKRWHTKKTRARLKRRRITAKLNWRRLHQYRQARLFVTRRAQGQLQGQLRDGARHRARLYSFAVRKAGRWSSFSIRRVLKRGLKTGQRSSTLRAALHATHLQRQRLLEGRLDSLRLRAHKALLWKAPLQPCPAAGELNPLFTRDTHWHADPITLHPAFALTQRQELRRSVLTGRAVRATTLAPAHFGQRGQAIRVNRQTLLPAFTAIKFSKSLTPIKKIQSCGRLSRIGRAAFRPRRLNFRTKQPYFSLKKVRAKKAPARRIRALRRVSFRKNRFFMRRLSTAGYRVDLLGKLIPKRTLQPIISRPLRASMRRRKPLRRSLRRRLAKRAVRRRNPVRLRKVRSSTGRILSKQKPRCRHFKRWRLKKNRKAARTICKRVGAVNTLLEQLEQLAALRTRITTPKWVRTSKHTSPASSRHLAAIWRGATTVRLLLRAPRRISRLRRLRRRITVPTSIQRLRSTTLQSKTLRRFIAPLRRKPKKKLFRSLLRVAKKHRRKHRKLRRLLRHTLRPTSRHTLLRALLRTLPELTPGKYRWLRRRYRKSLRRVKRTPTLCITRKGASYKLRIAPNRARLSVRVTTCLTNKVDARGRKLLACRARKVNSQLRARSLQKLLVRHKALAPSKKKKAKLKPQLRKLTTPRARSKIRMNSRGSEVPATASPRVSAVPARARPSRYPAEKTPVAAPTVVVPAPLPPASVPALPTAAPDKKIVPHFRQIRVRFSTPQLDKKISQFNKEPNIFTKKAYDALMSGVKSSWTALEKDDSTFPKAQRESEATNMERLYKEFYGVEPVRGNPKSIPDFKQYDANRKATQSTNNNKN